MAIIGVIMLLAGVFGATITGIVLDKTAAFKRLITISILVFLLTFALFCYSVLADCSHILTFVLMFPFGFSLVSIMPASLGLGVELTFPKIEPVLVNGMMLLFAQI